MLGTVHVPVDMPLRMALRAGLLRQSAAIVCCVKEVADQNAWRGGELPWDPRVELGGAY